MTPWDVMGAGVGVAVMWRYHRWHRRPPPVRVHPLASDFEVAMGAFLRHIGWTNVANLGGSGDNGGDLIGTTPDGRLMVVQCKFTTVEARVGSPIVRSVIGARAIYSADGAVVATTGSFTGPALALAAEMGVECWDGAFLRRF